MTYYKWKRETVMKNTQLQSFIRKYGAVAGPIIFRLLKTNAANARWKRPSVAQVVNEEVRKPIFG